MNNFLENNLTPSWLMNNFSENNLTPSQLMNIFSEHNSIPWTINLKTQVLFLEKDQICECCSFGKGFFFFFTFNWNETRILQFHLNLCFSPVIVMTFVMGKYTFKRVQPFALTFLRGIKSKEDMRAYDVNITQP